ncbi:MAG TPA: hypothetical protein EYQ83_20085 [Acidobacteria bacterium]|nr:hypothetical protein [Acidobacteriota bacterium]
MTLSVVPAAPHAWLDSFREFGVFSVVWAASVFHSGCALPTEGMFEKIVNAYRFVGEACLILGLLWALLQAERGTWSGARFESVQTRPRFTDRLSSEVADRGSFSLILIEFHLFSQQIS